MAFELPKDIIHNRGLIADPAAFAAEHKAASWVFLVGTEFASMHGGMTYAQVQAAVPRSINIISDPPRELTLELARQHVAALDKMPRPTLITCRAGPRSSAVAYMYAGLRAGVEPSEVLAAAERDLAPINEDLKKWIVETMTALRSEGV